MSYTKDILEERRDLALSIIDDVVWTIEPIESDDYGDTAYKWYVKYTLTLDGKDYNVWEDYYVNKPDDVQLYNNLLESIKDGFVGDTIADLITQHKGDDK